MKRLLTLLTLIISALLFNVQTSYGAPQAVYTVDRSDDAGGLPCTAAANDCTLRSAIEQANASPANDSILFDSSRTISLTGPLPELTGPGTLIAAWPAQDVNINLNGAANAFSISGDNISISGLDIYDGSTTASALIIIKGAAENIKLYDNLIGDYLDGATTCSTYQGGVTGINLLADDLAPSGVRLYVYGNEIRCLSVGLSLAGSNAFVGENASGNAETEQKNKIFANTHGIIISGGGVHRIRNNDIYAQELTGISIDNSASTRIYGNEIYNNGTDGVYLVNGAQSNVIGCEFSGSFDPVARRNVIYGNGEDGIHISGFTSSGLPTNFNYVSCNYIGLQADGSTAGNGGSGVHLSNGATTNFIGTTTDRENVIGSNGGHGVFIQNSDNNLVQGNEIGSFNTSLDRGNGGSGIAIQGSGSFFNLIGSSAAANMNSITFNDAFGVYLLDAGEYNDIRRSIVGYLGRANASGGIAVENTNRAGIGTSFVCADVSGSDCLLVYANGGNGIWLRNADETIIGEGAYVFGNNGAGVLIQDSNNSAVRLQTVGSNTAAGVSVIGASAGNAIQVSGRIYDNSGLPIDLNGDGFTPNDAGDADSGPNSLLNFPVTTTPAGSVNAAGTACPNCLVDIYLRNSASGYYQYLGAATADGSGSWTYDLSGAGATQDDAAFVAADSSGNTSEMSPLGGVVSYALFLPLIIK